MWSLNEITEQSRKILKNPEKILKNPGKSERIWQHGKNTSWEFINKSSCREQDNIFDNMCTTECVSGCVSVCVC